MTSQRVKIYTVILSLNMTPCRWRQRLWIWSLPSHYPIMYRLKMHWMEILGKLSVLCKPSNMTGTQWHIIWIGFLSSQPNNIPAKLKNVHINLNDGDCNLNRRWCVYRQVRVSDIGRDLLINAFTVSLLCLRKYYLHAPSTNSKIINDDGSLRVKH